MAEMMKPFFVHLENGEAIMQAQFAEIFPQGIEAHIDAQEQKSKTEFVPMLDELIATIKNASSEDLEAALNNECNNSRLYLVLNKFRAAFTDLSHSEKIFNPHHLLKAYEAYANQFEWDTDWKKLALFWSQVIGFVQRFLPANYAQVFAYSLYDIVENKHPCPRSFNFRCDSDFSFYPSVGSFAGVGFNYGAALTGGGPGGPGWGYAWAAGFIKIYIEQKTASFQNLLRRECSRLIA